MSNVTAKLNVDIPYKSRLIFINLNNKTIKAIETQNIENIDSNGNIQNGKVYYHKFDGEFLIGYLVINGETVKRLLPKKDINTANFLSFFSLNDDCNEQLNPNGIFCDQELDGFTINATKSTPPKSSPLYYYILDHPTLEEDSYVDETRVGGGGSGGDENQDNTCSGGKVYNSVSGNCECAEGMIEDSSGNCIDNPCDDIKSQINATGFKGKKDELNKLTGKKEETGYVENKDGTFTKLNPIKNGHSLDLTGISFRNINGFIHTHLDDFETGKFDEETGLPEVNEIFRMFSPADVIAFLSIAKISTDISQVYATVITSSGDYMLRFTGNQNDITGVKLANDYKEDYIKYMKRYTNKEQGFLHFLKNHIKVNGIELYKLHKPLFSSDIKIEHKTLDTKGKVDKTECE